MPTRAIRRRCLGHRSTPYVAIDTHIIWHERTHHSLLRRWLLERLKETAG